MSQFEKVMRVCGAVFFAAFATPVLASAQECPAGAISTIEVERLEVFDPEATKGGGFGKWILDLGNTIHITTKESYVRGDLMFKEGDCFDPFLMEESARVLRSREFIKWAEVTHQTQPDGNVAVHVEVQDDWTLKLGLGLSFDEGLNLEELLLKEANLLGRGSSVAFARTQNREVLENSINIRATRLAGTQATTDLKGGSTRYGNFFEGELAYPYISEISEFAAQANVDFREDYFPFTTSGVENPTHVLLPYQRKFFQVTLGRRIGDPGAFWIVGGGFSRENLNFPEGAEGLMNVLDGEYGDAVPATQTEIEEVRGQANPLAATRLNLFGGWREIKWVVRDGIDKVVAPQDVQVGTEVTLSLNPSIPVNTSVGDAEDIHGKLDIFWGAAPGEWIFSGILRGEGRYAFEEQGTPDGFRDILTELDLKAYVKLGDTSRHTLFTRISAARSWNMDRLFQLTGGGREGVRGYSLDAFPGGRRVLATVEDRFPLLQVEMLDLGLALFGDLGKVWGQDVPFGVDSGWRSALGVGFRINAPKGGFRTIRVDFTYPLSSADERQGVYFRVYTELGGILQLGKRPGQVERSRWSGIDTDLTTARTTGG
jgi:hypothetical protein